MNKALLRLVKEQDYHTPDTCAYRILLDLKIDHNEDISQESPLCLNCSGVPKSCASYTDLEHIINYYRLMRGEIT